MFKAINSFLFIVSFLCVGAWVGYSYPYPERYFDIQAVQVINQPVMADQVIHLDVDRRINAEFYGQYTVDVLQFDSEQNGYRAYCRGGNELHYRVDSVLPLPGDASDDLNLGFWAFKTETEKCRDGSISEPGIYYIKTCWRIERPWTFSIWTCQNTPNFNVIGSALPPIKDNN